MTAPLIDSFAEIEDPRQLRNTTLYPVGRFCVFQFVEPSVGRPLSSRPRNLAN